MRPLSRHLRLAFLPLLLFASIVDADEIDLDKEIKRGVKTITARGGRTHLLYLAGPKCEGRSSGERGCDVAADYIEGVLKDLGLEPGADGDNFRQTFTVRAGPFPGQRPKQGREVGPKPTSNIVAILEGSDPELAGEYLVLGAHYDHIGYEDLRKQKVYWGADDNASGTSAVLLVAEAFAKGAIRPRRSLIFILFSGEERGLLGSKHYVSRPVRPLAKTVAMLNMDMVGRNDPARMDVYGSQSSPELSEANLELAKLSRFRIRMKGGSVFMRSDHYPFYEKDVPVLFFSTGLHGDLHDLDDEPAKINWKKVERSAEHVYRLIWEIAGRDERPSFKKLLPSGAAGIIGFIPAQLSATEMRALKIGRKRGAVGVSQVLPDSPAAKAEMKEGDLVIGLAGKYLDDEDPLQDLDKIADGLKSGRVYPLLLLRDGRSKKLPIQVR